MFNISSYLDLLTEMWVLQKDTIISSSITFLFILINNPVLCLSSFIKYESNTNNYLTIYKERMRLRIDFFRHFLRPEN